MKPILLLVVVGLLVGAALCGPGVPVPPGNPIIGGSKFALITYDINKPPAYLDNETFWNALDAHPGKGKWHNVPSKSTFNDDQPEFKSLKAEADKSSGGADWIVIGTAKRVIDSEALPADEAATEKLIGKYAK